MRKKIAEFLINLAQKITKEELYLDCDVHGYGYCTDNETGKVSDYELRLSIGDRFNKTITARKAITRDELEEYVDELTSVLEKGESNEQPSATFN